MRILKEVFRCDDGDYARDNAYWKAHDIVAMIEALEERERPRLLDRVASLTEIYRELSAAYQAVKAEGDIPLA